MRAGHDGDERRLTRVLYGEIPEDLIARIRNTPWVLCLPPRLDTPLLFPAPAGGPLRLDNWRRREWAPAVEASGVARPARIYDLRSTFASDALAAGVKVFELARVMGTSVRMIERHYGALLDGAGAGIAGRLDALESSETWPRRAPGKTVERIPPLSLRMESTALRNSLRRRRTRAMTTARGGLRSARARSSPCPRRPRRHRPRRPSAPVARPIQRSQ
jgi:hypothetical protein